MNLIILAAGKGNRLLPVTLITPKVLLNISGEDTLLDFQVRQALALPEIKNVVIVVGYHSDEIKKHISERYQYERVKIVVNPKYSINNPLISLYQANEYLHDDFLISNGDTYFESNVFQKIALSTHGITLAVAKKKDVVQSGMMVKATDTILNEVNQYHPHVHAEYESMGVVFVQGEDACNTFRAGVDNLVRKFSNEGHIWHDVLNEVKKSFPIHIHDASDCVWFEVDTAGELEKLRSYFLAKQ